ncbi:MAG: NDP-sugar synthase [Pseudomonadales bacterium]|nr:NDP-sugar synthase [Pseudomonadales bacterium]MDG1441894.1 NDP-sugar synthase [Pseudomonadales bacterium]
MKAMILSAGQGTRLQPVTANTPKSMVPLVGVRLLDRILDRLTEQGINQVAINSAHLSDEITSHYGNGNQFGAEILHSFEGYRADGESFPQPLGSAGGMMKIQQDHNFFDETFIVLCGDAYFDIDLWAAVREHITNRAVATVIVKEMPDEKLANYGVVNYDPDGSVRSFQEKPAAADALSNKINTGIYIFQKSIFDHIPKTGEFDIGSQLLPSLVEKGIKFYAHETTASWLDIGKIADLHEATENVLKLKTKIRPSTKRFSHSVWLSESACFDPTRVVCFGNLFVEAGSKIETNAVFEGTCSVGKNCVVRRAAKLTRTLITGSFVEIPSGVHLVDKIVTDDLVIALDGSSVSHEQAGLLDVRRLPKGVVAINTNEKTATK